MLALAVAAFVATAAQPDPALLPSALIGALGSSPFAGLAMAVIHWQRKDLERHQAAAEKALADERADRAAERERELAMQERLISTSLAQAQAIQQSSDLLEQVAELLR